MAYIGKQPTVGNFVKLDTITTSATDTFNLTNGTVAYYPQSPNHCIVSLNGVIQSPTTSFTISGSTIVFASALTSNDVIDFILVLGDVLNIGTPSDNTVSLAKLTATGTKDSTTFLRGDNTFAVAGGTNTPAFRVRLSADQSITTGTDTKINFNTEDYDTDNAISSGTFTVPSGKDGIYQISSAFMARSASNNVTVGFVYIYKNGSQFAYQYFNIPSGASIRDHFVCINTALELNAGDTIEIYARVDGTSPVVEIGTNGAYFNMYKIIE